MIANKRIYYTVHLMVSVYYRYTDANKTISIIKTSLINKQQKHTKTIIINSHVSYVKSIILIKDVLKTQKKYYYYNKNRCKNRRECKMADASTQSGGSHAFKTIVYCYNAVCLLCVYDPLTRFTL